MGYRNVDDMFDTHPKVRALARMGKRRCASALALWVLAGCESRREVDRGRSGEVSTVYVESTPCEKPIQAAFDLEEVGLWDRTDRGWLFHDEDDWNQPRAVRQRKLRQNRERQARFKAKRNALPNAVASDPVTQGNAPQSSPVQSSPDPVLKESVSSEVREVWLCWQTHHGTDRMKLTNGRRSKITARLRDGIPVDVLKAAIRGALSDPWSMGTAPSSTTEYRGVDNILRDADKVERMAKLDGKPLNGRPRRGMATVTTDPAIIEEGKRELREEWSDDAPF